MGKEYYQYYTKPDIAKELIQSLPLKRFDIIIDPCCGNGSFSNKIPHCIAYDIQGAGKGIIKQDFLTVELSVYENKKVLFVSNPPFGVNNSLSVKFINKCSELETVTIAFILSSSFKNETMLKRINPYLHLLKTIDLPINAFTFNGKDHKVKCSFFIFEKRDYKRETKEKELKHTGYVWTNRENGNIAIRRAGRGAGKASIATNQNESTHYFLLVRETDKQRYIDHLNTYDYDFNNSVINAVSKETLNGILSLLKTKRKEKVETPKKPIVRAIKIKTINRKNGKGNENITAKRKELVRALKRLLKKELPQDLKKIYGISFEYIFEHLFYTIIFGKNIFNYWVSHKRNSWGATGSELDLIDEPLEKRINTILNNYTKRELLKIGINYYTALVKKEHENMEKEYALFCEKIKNLSKKKRRRKESSFKYRSERMKRMIETYEDIIRKTGLKLEKLDNRVIYSREYRDEKKDIRETARNTIQKALKNVTGKNKTELLENEIEAIEKLLINAETGDYEKVYKQEIEKRQKKIETVKRRAEYNRKYHLKNSGGYKK